MKRIFLIVLAGLAWIPAARADEPAASSLLMYISPADYRYETRLGLVPYYIVWVRQGPMLEQAARKAFQPHFSQVEMCEGNNGADVVVWLKPEMYYHPMLEVYRTRVSARFYRADGKLIGRHEATGEYHGSRGSRLSDAQVQHALDSALQQIARQYADDSALRQAISQDVTKSPCAMVALIPGE